LFVWTVQSWKTMIGKWIVYGPTHFSEVLYHFTCIALLQKYSAQFMLNIFLHLCQVSIWYVNRGSCRVGQKSYLSCNFPWWSQWWSSKRYSPHPLPFPPYVCLLVHVCVHACFHELICGFNLCSANSLLCGTWWMEEIIWWWCLRAPLQLLSSCVNWSFRTGPNGWSIKDSLTAHLSKM
jgi:hypothetical protein